MGNIGKRFTDPSVWENPFFTDLSTEQRLFWLYLNSRCDLAGVFQLHYPVDSAYLGVTIDRDFVKEFLNCANADKSRVEPLEGQRLWLVEYVRYQQANTPDGSLSNAKHAGAHKKVVKLLKEHSIFEKAVDHDSVLYQAYTGQKTETHSRGTQDPLDTQSTPCRESHSVSSKLSSCNNSDNGVGHNRERSGGSSQFEEKVEAPTGKETTLEFEKRSKGFPSRLKGDKLIQNFGVAKGETPFG